MPYQFQISARVLNWPRQCACCAGTPDSNLRASASRTTGKRVKHTTTYWWEVPYCSTCLSHKAAYEAAFWWLWLGLGFALLIWYAIGGTAGLAVGLGVLVASFWPFGKAKAKARAQMKGTCCNPVAAVRYRGWYGSVHTFEFDSETYTTAFLDANGRKTRSDVKRV